MSDRRLAIVQVPLDVLHRALSGQSSLEIKFNGEFRIPFSECHIISVFSDALLASFIRNENPSITLKVEANAFDIVMEGSPIPYAEAIEKFCEPYPAITLGEEWIDLPPVIKSNEQFVKSKYPNAHATANAYPLQPDPWIILSGEQPTCRRLGKRCKTEALAWASATAELRSCVANASESK